jgi:S-adenosylmethionine/arginine decarboxylase-like enzyme
MSINAIQTENNKSAGPSPGLVFGWELVLDLYECNKQTISDETAIKRFARELCEVIDMKPYGEPLTPYFGEKLDHTKGYSLLQFVETSSIVGHFAEDSGAVYLNIFSCKKYDIDKAESFAQDYFGAERVHSRFIVRE